MRVKGRGIGFALTGSHCTYEEIFPQIQRLQGEGAILFPICSQAVVESTTRFGQGADIVSRLQMLTGKEVICDIVGAEVFGPKTKLDLLVIAPCTGNTLAKLANGITDTAVLMAAKAQLRNGRPVVLAVSTNDGLGMNARNLGTLMSTEHVFFVPLGQDNPLEKPNSLVADMECLLPTIEKALDYEQIQPVLIDRALRSIR